MRLLRDLAVALALLAAAHLVYNVAAAPLIPAAGQGYWHAVGTQLYDQNGRPVRIAGVTWYGMESSYWVPAGLDYQPYTRIMREVKTMGFNTIRLPISNEMVERNPIVTQKVNANPKLKGRHAMHVLDLIMRYAQHLGLKIILDDHRSIAARPKRVNFLDEGFWYTPQYPESSWIRDWKTLARRYKGNTAFIGCDLRNEPHTNGPGPWNLHAYLYQGSTWGTGNRASDWRLAAERAGNAILSVNPHLLIIVEGVQMYPDRSYRTGVETYWWGSILRGVATKPVVLDHPHQLMYEAHDWGPKKWYMPWFRNDIMTYQSMESVWHKNWSFIDNPTASYAAPIWIGEFGTCTNLPLCVTNPQPGNQALWLQFFLRYLHEHPEINWSFFALNGTNSNDHAANNGLLNPDWSAPANPQLIRDLQTVQHR